MAIIFKPSTRKGPVLILPEDVSTPPTITLSDGTVVTAVKGDRAGGVYQGHEGFQWVFDEGILGQTNAVLTVGDKTQTLANTNMSYRGVDLGNLQESSKGAIGTGPLEGPGGAFQKSGEFGVAPQFIGDQFPDPQLIEGAARGYQYIDPIQFGREFNQFQRGELATNLQQAGSFALDIIDTEFAGLERFVPRSAALKRATIAEDQRFNQAQRTAQIEDVLGAQLQDLDAQAARARTYAAGDVPDEVIDRGFEIGLRSEAADIAATSGFGIRSSAAQKISSLMSARERIGLAMQGEALTTQNIREQERLRLAPTSYSTAGETLNVAPTLSGSQLQVSQAQEINQQSLVPASQAYGSAAQQSQFLSNLVQRTQEFNAVNVNDFALSYFNYLNAYANSVAGAAQTNINTQVSLEQQALARNEANKQKDKTQKGNDIKAGLGAVGSIIGGVAAFGGFGGGDVIGEVATGNFFDDIFSDRQLKENVELYTKALQTIEKLDIYKFRYKSGIAYDGKDHVGVIAQELQEILPDNVSVDPSGYLKVEATDLVFMLIAAVKELSEKVNRLENGV